MDYATTADVSALRPLTAAEEQQAALFIAYASVLLRSRVPDLDARLASGALDPALPRMVVVSAVVGALGRLRVTPGAKSESTTTGPYTHSVTYGDAIRSGLLTISDDDLAPLLPVTTGASVSAGVGTIRLQPGFGGW